MLQKILIKDFENSSGTIQDIHLSYQVFGKPLNEAPVVLVNHALTGNSLVTGNSGWWNEMVGPSRCIDTDNYSVLAFNVPGNGFEGEDRYFDNYREFRLRDIARIQLLALESLKIEKLYAVIGGSIGGALAWELAALKPELAENIIPIASDYKSTDWLVANCRIQDHILNNSSNPVNDARMHAMTFYRTPQSLAHKFEGRKNGDQVFEVESWLLHHGDKLKNRFSLPAYKLMNHLLTTIDISNGTGKQLEAASKIEGHIHIVTVNSDLFFLAEENWNAYVDLSLLKNEVSIHEIRSMHGHDAFLIETDQLNQFLRPVFEKGKINRTLKKHREKERTGVGKNF